MNTLNFPIEPRFVKLLTNLHYLFKILAFLTFLTLFSCELFLDAINLHLGAGGAATLPRMHSFTPLFVLNCTAIKWKLTHAKLPRFILFKSSPVCILWNCFLLEFLTMQPIFLEWFKCFHKDLEALLFLILFKSILLAELQHDSRRVLSHILKLLYLILFWTFSIVYFMDVANLGANWGLFTARRRRR